MKHDVRNLEGALLDAAVAKADGIAVWFRLESGVPVPYLDRDRFDRWWPSQQWLQGGPIIERERIACGPSVEGTGDPDELHYAMRIAGNGQKDGAYFWGPTRLVAAMRAFVASKLGVEVDL
jgi:hypothetical protein